MDSNMPSFQLFFQTVDNLAIALDLDVPQIVVPEKLKLLSIGTLGRTLADFLTTNNLKPLTGGFRRKQLHDSVHVLTGYETDLIGEAEIQAFLLGAKFHFAQIVIGSGLLYLIHRRMPNHSLGSLKNRLTAAFDRGRNSTFNVDTWQPELQWQLPITEVRKIYSL
jgi:ubiquinone biosynthesis protein COQ4